MPSGTTRFVAFKSSYTLVIQRQNRQTMAHGFQNLRAKRILQAREKESIRTLIQARHFFPRHLTEELYPVAETQALRALLPRLAHFTVASNQQPHSEVSCLCQGLKR